LHRLRRLDDAPAVAWLSWPAQLLARVPPETTGALVAIAVALGLRALGGPPHADDTIGDVAGRFLIPAAGAIIAFRIARALVLAARRSLVARAAVRRAALLAARVDALGALPNVGDGTLVSCVGRVRCRQPFQLPDEAGVTAAVIQFAGAAREDVVAADALGRPTPAPLFGRRSFDGSEDPSRALLAFLTRPAWIEAVFEVASDFDVVGEDGAAARVVTADAQLIVVPTQRLGDDAVRADAILAALQAPLAAAGAANGRVHFLREGDAVEVIGFKDTDVTADAAARLERESPLGTTLRARADLPLLLIPLPRARD
jgi:hypothetical protein